MSVPIGSATVAPMSARDRIVVELSFRELAHIVHSLAVRNTRDANILRATRPLFCLDSAVETSERVSGPSSNSASALMLAKCPLPSKVDRRRATRFGLNPSGRTDLGYYNFLPNSPDSRRGILPSGHHDYRHGAHDHQSDLCPRRN